MVVTAMTEMHETPQHRHATSASVDGGRVSDARQAKAVALLNYAQALQEYLEDQLPRLWPGQRVEETGQALAGHLVALDALSPMISLLTAVGSGKPMNQAEVKSVLTQTKAAFAESGVVRPPSVASSDFRTEGDAPAWEAFGWSVPEWCLGKLCRGMEELSSDGAESRRIEIQV